MTTTNGTTTSGRKLHASRTEALAHKPTDGGKNMKVFEISKNGTVLGYLWANGYADCSVWAAREEGYTASATTEKEIAVNDAAARLASLSDAELAALGLVRQPAAS